MFSSCLVADLQQDAVLLYYLYSGSVFINKNITALLKNNIVRRYNDFTFDRNDIDNNKEIVSSYKNSFKTRIDCLWR